MQIFFDYANKIILGGIIITFAVALYGYVFYNLLKVALLVLSRACSTFRKDWKHWRKQHTDNTPMEDDNNENC